MNEPLIWAEVDLGAYARNLAALTGHAGPGARIMAVVKADAYGHGAIACADAAVGAGANCLGVAIVEEGVQLRTAGNPATNICDRLLLPEPETP